VTAAPLIWLPDALDHLEHAVTDSDVVWAGAAGAGHVIAVCSASVLLCSLATPAARRCPECDAQVFGRPDGDGHRGLLGWLRRR
jgi:hypothetical protein